MMSPEEMIERWREIEYGGDELCLTYAQCETELTAALKSAREEGRREGIEEAAKVCAAMHDEPIFSDPVSEYGTGQNVGAIKRSRQLEDEIRALAAKEDQHGS